MPLAWMVVAGGRCYTEPCVHRQPGTYNLGALKYLFTQFEDDHRRNARLIAGAARASGVSEYELFQLAYLAWHRSEPEQQRLEKIFVAYLFSGRVPVWVQDFVQRAGVDAEIERFPGALCWCLEYLLVRMGGAPWSRSGGRHRIDRLQA